MTAGPQRSGLRRLRKRAQFLSAARGQRTAKTGFSLQVIAVEMPEPGIGLTVTKKTGNSPERNRIKRRLRAATQACQAQFQPHYDYVLVARREALSLPFSKIITELSSAIAKVHAPPRAART